MSGRDESVLERNLRALLPRCYEPVVPRVSFRERLGQDFEARALQRFAPRAAAPPRAGWVRWAAAALVLLGLGVLLRGALAPDADRGADLGTILASGRVAVSADGSSWRPARLDAAALPAEGVSELDELAACELRTPAGRAARIRRDGLELRVDADSSVALLASPDGDASGVNLRAGALELRVDGERALPLVTAQGTLQLARVHLRARADEAPEFGDPEAGWVALELLAGELHAPAQGAASSVAAPARVWLSAGRLQREPTTRVAAVPETSVRRPVGWEPRESEALTSAEMDGDRPVVLRGVVRAAPAPGETVGAPVTSFSLILLEEKNLPDPAHPVLFRREDAGGRFEIPPQPPGNYTLFVQAAEHAVWRRTGLVLGAAPARAEDVLELDVNLDAGLTVRGVVLRADTRAPVRGAVVLSESDAPAGVLPIDEGSLEDARIVRFERTGPDGGFELRNVSRGTQVLRASGGGLAVGWPARLELQGTRAVEGIEILLEEFAPIEGRVESEDGTPLAGQVVLASCSDFAERRPTLTYRHALTDADGNYRIEGMPAGMIAVLRFGSREAMETEIAPDLRLVTLRTGELTRVDFKVRETGSSLTGILVDESGSAISGRALWAMPDDARGGFDPDRWKSASSQDDGSFRFPHMEPGDYVLFATGRAPSELMRVGAIEVDGGAPQELRLVLGGARLSGHVHDASDGSVPPRATILLIEREGGIERLVGKALVGPDGAFLFEDVPAGLHDLLAIDEGEGDLEHVAIESLAVAPGATIEDLDFELGPGGELEVEVRLGSPEGPPGAGARVEFYDARGRSIILRDTPRANARGRERVHGLSYGTWTVEVSLAGHSSARRQVEIAAPEQARILIVLDPEQR